MATNSKPSARRRLDRGQLVDAAEQHQRHRQRVAELAGERQEEAPPRTGAREDPAAEHPQPERRRAGPWAAANSFIGTSPRKKYMPLSSELPPVSSRASRWPSASRSWADLEALVEPEPVVDAVGHVELGQHRDAAVGHPAHGLDHPAGEAGAVLDAAAELVVRLLRFGLRNELSR